MHRSTKPPIHLWIYNHPFHGISDQVDFFVMSMEQHGYRVSVGRQPKLSSLNVVIENFSADTKRVLMDFCKSARKRVAVIMTEHLDFEHDQIFIHGDPLWSENDYMHPATQLGRIKNLMDCLPYLRCFLVLGDLPELRNMSKMLPGVDIRQIPFPKLDFFWNKDSTVSNPMENDLLFTGFMTDYRANILAELKSNGFAVNSPQRFVSRNRRDAMNLTAKLILNIPQREGWRWLSLMRVVAALRVGRVTVSLGTNDQSAIAACCPQLDIREPGWPAVLREWIERWDSLYPNAHAGYTEMSDKFEHVRGFPHDALEFWAITDRLADYREKNAIPVALNG